MVRRFVGSVGKAVNGHSQTLKSATVMSLLLGLTGWFANGWADHVNKTLETTVTTQRDVVANVAMVTEAVEGLKLSDVRTEGEIAHAVAALKDSIAEQNRASTEFRALNTKRWDRQEAVNDAIAQTLIDIRDKLPDRKP